MPTEPEHSGDTFKIIFVCRGNICRSPIALATFNEVSRRTTWSKRVVADSAGTSRWHAGEDMDPRARRELIERGYDVPTHTARRIGDADRDAMMFVALDTDTAQRLRSRGFSTAAIRLLGTYDPLPNTAVDIDDPFHGTQADFADAFHRIQRSVLQMCAAIKLTISR